MKEMPGISDAEWLVMRVLWNKSPVTTVEVAEALASTTSWKLKTVLTLLSRLAKKGAVGFEQQGRAYLYYPLIQERECVRAENRSFLERVHGGALKPMLASLFEQVDLTPGEIRELKDILDGKAKRK